MKLLYTSRHLPSPHPQQPLDLHRSPRPTQPCTRAPGNAEITASPGAAAQEAAQNQHPFGGDSWAPCYYHHHWRNDRADCRDSSEALSPALSAMVLGRSGEAGDTRRRHDPWVGRPRYGFPVSGNAGSCP